MENIKIVLSPKSRGLHIVTEEIIKHLPRLPQNGILHLFLQHTSAGICINESADPSVLSDMNQWFDKNVRENESYYMHTLEGADDMPAHIKTVLTGTELSIPIINSDLALGIWQGIYLCEFRNHASSRSIIATILS